MVIQRLGAVALVLALLTASCTSSTDDLGAPIGDTGTDDSGAAVDLLSPSVNNRFSESRLDAAKATWENADIENYQISATERRNFWSRGCTWITVVIAGEVAESEVDPISTGPTCTERELSVEVLFGQIEGIALQLDEFDNSSSGDNTLKVTYNDHGVPDWIGFDLLSVIDEEISLRVSFTTLP